MKKNTAIKSLLVTTILTTSMSGWFGYNNYNDQKEIDQLQQEQATILNNHTDLISNLESLEYELNTYKETNVDLKELIDTKNVEIKELEEQVSVKEEEVKKKQVVVSRGDDSSSDWIVYEATHYSSYCDTGCTGITAIGYDVRNTIYEQGYRVIAVDPRHIKLGSLVEVKTSYGSFKALAGDTGGAIKGHKIDILVENDTVANRLGREKVQVRIIK